MDVDGAVIATEEEETAMFWRHYAAWAALGTLLFYPTLLGAWSTGERAQGDARQPATLHGKWIAEREVDDGTERATLWLDPTRRYSLRLAYSFPEINPISVVERGRWQVADGRLQLSVEPGEVAIPYRYRLEDAGRRLVLLLDERKEWSFQRADAQTLVGSWHHEMQVPDLKRISALSLHESGGYVARIIHLHTDTEPGIHVSRGSWRVDGDRLILADPDPRAGEQAYRYRLSEDGQLLTWHALEVRSTRETVWRRVHNE